MSKDETAEIAKNMFGESLYQQRARTALPILVRQAIANRNITYKDLAEELDIPNARNLNFVLGSVGTTLFELAKQWQEEIPPIQCLVINQQTGLPGQGVDHVLTGRLTSNLDVYRKEILVKSALGKIYAYRKWQVVLKELGLPLATRRNLQLMVSADSGGGNGESDAHKQLKNYIAKHPECIAQGKSLAPGQTEFLLPSGDKVDVLFYGAHCRVAVEVKSRRSDNSDLTRGLFQCVKYRAVLQACRSVESKFYTVGSVLAIEGALPAALVPIRNTLGVGVIENIRVQGNH